MRQVIFERMKFSANHDWDYQQYCRNRKDQELRPDDYLVWLNNKNDEDLLDHYLWVNRDRGED